MPPLTIQEMMLRILAAFVTGLALGWERESHGRPAGLRTTTLACVASALAMILSEVLFAQGAATSATGSWRPDPTRLGAGVLTGIGFLGAGTIVRHENAILGITTAATLWFVTVLGLAFGSGQFALGAMGVALALLVLFLLPLLEKHIGSDWYATLTVTGHLEMFTEEEVKKRIESFGPTIKTIKLSYQIEKKQKTIACELKTTKAEANALSNKVVSEIARWPGVVEVAWG
jgi:putative Mg2+ transporter-C (MgtC) family protein